MAQHTILRFEKHKGNPARPLEAHPERQKEQYASNPDIDASRSKYDFHIVKPEGRYCRSGQNRIEQAGCRTRRDSTRKGEYFAVKQPCNTTIYNTALYLRLRRDDELQGESGRIQTHKEMV